MVKQALLMMTVWLVQPLHEWQTLVPVNALFQEDRWITVTDIVKQIRNQLWICIFHHPWQTSGITKFMQGGCPSSLLVSTNGHTWKCACDLCSSIVKEMWVHCYEPASRCQSMGWKHLSSPRTKKIESVPFAGKMMLTLVCYFNGPNL